MWQTIQNKNFTRHEFWYKFDQNRSTNNIEIWLVKDFETANICAAILNI